MSFALLIIGITLIVAAVRNTQDSLVDLLKKDFTGEGNFLYWVLAILAIGAVGYVPRLKPISDGLLVVVILVLILSRGKPTKLGGAGFFEKFTQAIATTKNTSSSSTAGNIVSTATGAVNKILNS